MSSNENPYKPSKKVMDAAIKGLENLNRYVDKKDVNMLKKTLGEYNDVSSERIVVGSGTNALFKEIIYDFSKNRNIMTFNPSFMSSIDVARYNARKIIKVQLTPPDFEIDWESLIIGPSLIVLDYPNNPTGKCLIKREDLIKLLKNKDCLILIDEAYYEFSKRTFIDLIDDYPNLAISRTLDKAYSLAGLRISYLIAGDVFLSRLRQYDSAITCSACYAAIAAIKDKEHAFDHVKKIIAERDRLSLELKKIGFEVYESRTNFLLVKTSIDQLALRLKKENILIGDLSRNWLSGYYRISIGNHEENNCLMNAIKNILSSIK
ncbi:MAG: aminotransferase class I/II-fold pyridoxal phosphate-dependent enzyme [Bacillota bacterium]|nr:aminotransferase class I/II-fold pyridoxal phosphate-dependent enzyme [Bacillota bacterium]